MKYKKEPGKKAIKSTLLSIICIFILLFLITPVDADYIPPSAYATEVLLNKPGIEYDLSILDKYADAGQVNKFSGNGYNPTTDTYESSFENYYGWTDEFYYIYRSHFDESLGVLIHTVNKTQISGLSVRIVIPTEPVELEREWVIISLNFNYTISVNSTFVSDMRNNGYIEFGTSMITEDMVGISLIKDEVQIFIASDENMTEPGSNETVMTSITVEGPKDAVDSKIEQDLRYLLDLLNFNPDEWNNSKRTEIDTYSTILNPYMDIDPYTVDWHGAMRTELEWLQKQGIVTGLSENDIEQIAKEVGPTLVDSNYRIVYESGSWKPYYKTELPLIIEWLGGSSSSYLAEDWIPAKPPEKLPEPKKDEFYYLNIIIASGIVVVFIISTFSYSRLKRRSILDNLNRKNIFEYVKEYPGVHFKKLLRELNFKPGALSYHLNVLEKGEFVKSIQDGNYRRFYLFGTKSDLKIMLTSIQLRILSIVDERPGISQSDISRTIGTNRMLVNYHVKILKDAGILSVEQAGRETQIYTTSHAENYLPG